MSVERLRAGEPDGGRDTGITLGDARRIHAVTLTRGEIGSLRTRGHSEQSVVGESDRKMNSLNFCFLVFPERSNSLPRHHEIQG